MAGSDLLSVVDSFYAAALEPERWQKALDALSGALGAIGATMVPLGIDRTMRAFASESLAEANAEYQQTWWRHYTATMRVFQRGLRPGLVGTDRLVISEEEIRLDPFYQDFLRRHGIRQTMAAVVSVGNGRLLSIGAQRSIKRELFQDGDVGTLAKLAPHIGRALAISTALVEARRMAGDLAEAVERLAWGVVMLSASGDVRHVNAVAESLLGDGLALAGRRLRAAARDDNERLQAAVAAALPGAGMPAAKGVLVRRSGAGGWLYVEVVPIRPKLEPLEIMTFGAGGAMLLIRSLDTVPRTVAHHLQAMGLTPAEARLAEAVGQGGSLKQVADASGIAYETARTQLRAVFAKLGVRRQGELTMIVMRLVSAAVR
ncbi:LuxR C-terminal-related transcriptional regulator [Xanthobacter sp. KR7-225]|uniref:helix-turn-helix transcriptional regulator n=1 Tax=Xanthobacter sp. KR7-225 TaxID=3156613 RepID=UPI0032B4113F